MELRTAEQIKDDIREKSVELCSKLKNYYESLPEEILLRQRLYRELKLLIIQVDMLLYDDDLKRSE